MGNVQSWKQKNGNEIGNKGISENLEVILFFVGLFESFCDGKHSVISPQNFEEKSGFCYRFGLGGDSLLNMPGEK